MIRTLRRLSPRPRALPLALAALATAVAIPAGAWEWTQPAAEPYFALTANAEREDLCNCGTGGVLCATASNLPRTCAARDYWYKTPQRSYQILEDGNTARHRDPQYLKTLDVTSLDPLGRQFIFDGYEWNVEEGVDRTEVQFSSSGGSDDTRIQQFGESRFFRIFFKVHARFGMSGSGAATKFAGVDRDYLITQFWQRMDGTLPEGPSFSLNLATTPPGAVDATWKSNNVVLELRYQADGEGGIFHREIIPRDKWVGIILQVKPAYKPVTATDPTARGLVWLWRLDKLFPSEGPAGWVAHGPDLRDDQAANYAPPSPPDPITQNQGVHLLYFGRRPTNPCQLNVQPGKCDRFDIRFGFYRNGSDKNELKTAVDPTYPRYFQQMVTIDSVRLTNRMSCLAGVDEICQ